MAKCRKILITGAGGGGSNNLIKSIRQSGYNCFIIGTNVDKFFLRKSIADKNYLLPRATEENYIPKLQKLIKKEEIELVIPNNDTEVRVVSDNREKLDCRTFLPDKDVIKICQDKYLMYKKMRKKGINLAKTIEIKDLDDVDRAFAELQREEEVLWCRLRRGSGSMGSLPVKTPEQAKCWIKYWEDMRGFKRSDFIISEYLPGRDFHFHCLWKDGEVVIGKTLERLSYIFARNMPSNTSSSPQVGKLVYEKEVVELCLDAIEAIDNNPNGSYGVDVKGNKKGEYCITEINIGRFPMITNAFNFVGKYNMAEIYLKLAFDEPVEIESRAKFADVGKDMYLIRELDTLPEIFSKEEIERNINYI